MAKGRQEDQSAFCPPGLLLCSCDEDVLLFLVALSRGNPYYSDVSGLQGDLDSHRVLHMFLNSPENDWS